MSGHKLIHQQKPQQAVYSTKYVKINVRASPSRAVYRRRCVPPRAKK